jgi:hypothetical protein
VNTDNPPSSQIAGVSVRGWIALVCVVTVCIISTMGMEIREPLYTMAGMAVAFYLGQKTKVSA